MIGASSLSRTTRTSWASVGDVTEHLPPFADGGQTHQVVHVELVLFRRVELPAIQYQPLPSKAIRLGAVPHVFEVDEEAFGGPPHQRDTPAAARHERLDAFAQVPARAGCAHPEGPAPAVRGDHAPDLHGVGGLHALAGDLHVDPLP
jgi:hypothetical protein